jgi:hypothetical protein
MSNVRFAYTDLGSYHIFDTTADPAYPVENLQNYVAAYQWRAIAPGNASLNIDFGVTRNRNYLMIQNHNLKDMASPKLQAAHDDTFSTGLVDVVTDFSTADDPGFFPFTQVAKRFWRIIDDAGTPSVNTMAIGQVFIDKLLDFGAPYDFPANDANAEYQTTKIIALNGMVRSSQPFAGRLTWLITFTKPGLSDAIQAEFQTFFTTVRGMLRPYYFINTNDEIFFVQLDIDIDPTKLFRANINLFDKIPMKEQLATQQDREYSGVFIWDESKFDGPDKFS